MGTSQHLCHLKDNCFNSNKVLTLHYLIFFHENSVKLFNIASAGGKMAAWAVYFYVLARLG